MKISVLVILTALLCLSMTVAKSSIAHAHHGWGWYSQSIDLQAEIVEIDLGNPHDILIAKDLEGEKWQLLLAPPVRNRRFGFGPGSVEVGQEVRLVGERHPKKREAKIHQIWSGEKLIYEYKYSSGRTSLERFGRNE